MASSEYRRQVWLQPLPGAGVVSWLRFVAAASISRSPSSLCCPSFKPCSGDVWKRSCLPCGAHGAMLLSQWLQRGRGSWAGSWHVHRARSEHGAGSSRLFLSRRHGWGVWRLEHRYGVGPGRGGRGGLRSPCSPVGPAAGATPGLREGVTEAPRAESWGQGRGAG